MTDQPEDKKTGLIGRLSEMMQTAVTILQSHSDDPTRSPLDPTTSKAEFDAIQAQIRSEDSDAETQPIKKPPGMAPR